MTAFDWAFYGLCQSAVVGLLAIVIHFLVTFNREFRRPQKIKRGLAAVAAFESERGAFTDKESAAAYFRIAYEGRGRGRAG